MEGSPWELAKAIGLGYGGDMNPVPHGGLWYDYSRWETHGEAAYTRCYPADGAFAVERGTIYKPDAKTIASAYNCCGIHLADVPEELRTRVEIESVVAHSSTEQDDMQWFEKDENHYDDFNEFKICRLIREYLNQTIPED
jgi:hypothetical protein